MGNITPCRLSTSHCEENYIIKEFLKFLEVHKKSLSKTTVIVGIISQANKNVIHEFFSTIMKNVYVPLSISYWADSLPSSITSQGNVNLQKWKSVHSIEHFNLVGILTKSFMVPERSYSAFKSSAKIKCIHDHFLRVAFFLERNQAINLVKL